MFIHIINIAAILLTITVHEYGHYIVAQRNGIVAEEFSVGIGPALYQFNYQGTLFSLRVIPIAGYVLLEPQELKSLSTWQQVKVYLAGPMANLALCMVLAPVIIMLGVIPFQNTNLEHVSLIVLAVVSVPVTVMLFFVFVPLTMWLLVDMLLHPIVNLPQVQGGPIGIYSGNALSGMVQDMPPITAALVLLYVLSFSVGTFNLVPFSILDGGRIFRTVFSKFPRFVGTWNAATSAFLLCIVLYLTLGDIMHLNK
jgi:membrane-associated protease RseP (regulator of RpoE activity)